MALEDITQTSQIKAIKAAIPYMEPDNAMRMWIVAKLLEIKSIIGYYKNFESGDDENMDLEKLFSGDIFKAFDDDGKGMVSELMEKIQGKSHEEMMPMVMELFSKLGGKGVTEDSHKESILGALKDHVSPDDIHKFEMMAKMFMGGKKHQ